MQIIHNCHLDLNEVTKRCKMEVALLPWILRIEVRRRTLLYCISLLLNKLLILIYDFVN